MTSERHFNGVLATQETKAELMASVQSDTKRARDRSIVMVGTSLLTKGGISSVVNVYVQAGLFDRWAIVYISSHIDDGCVTKMLYAAGAILRYSWFLLAKRVELVHVHSASNASFWRKAVFVLLARLAHRPVIFHLHGGGFVDFFQKECNRFGKMIVRFVLDKADCIVVQSDYWKTSLAGITRNKNIVPICNPVVIPAHDMVITEGRRQNVVLFLARVSGEKGIYDLLRAIAAIAKNGRSVVLKVAGDGELSQVHRLAEELGIHEFVELLGWTTGPAKQSLLAESTVFVLPSYAEGLPMGLLEAMAAELPVVATRIGAVPEVVQDGVDGFLVDPGDINALAHAIERLLADTDLRKQLATAANKKIVAHYSAERVLPRIESVYWKLGARPKDYEQGIG